MRQINALQNDGRYPRQNRNVSNENPRDRAERREVHRVWEAENGEPLPLYDGVRLPAYEEVQVAERGEMVEGDVLRGPPPAYVAQS